MPISELIEAKVKKIGIKQSSRAIIENKAEALFIAEDVEQHVTRRILILAKEHNVRIEYVESMKELGKACKIDVGAATAVVIK